jgi:hypothetical protein
MMTTRSLQRRCGGLFAACLVAVLALASRVGAEEHHHEGGEEEEGEEHVAPFGWYSQYPGTAQDNRFDYDFNGYYPEYGYNPYAYAPQRFYPHPYDTLGYTPYSYQPAPAFPEYYENREFVAPEQWERRQREEEREDQRRFSADERQLQRSELRERGRGGAIEQIGPSVVAPRGEFRNGGRARDRD